MLRVAIPTKFHHQRIFRKVEKRAWRRYKFCVSKGKPVTQIPALLLRVLTEKWQKEGRIASI